MSAGLSAPHSYWSRLVFRVWHSAALLIACLGVVFGIGLVASVVLWWILDLTLPGEMSWRHDAFATRAQIIWFFIGLSGLALASSWTADLLGWVPVSCLVAPLLGMCVYCLVRLTRMPGLTGT